MSPEEPTLTPDASPEPPPPEPLAEEVTRRLPLHVHGLSCPSCGGALEVDPGLRVVVCPYCQTPLLALSEPAIRRLAVMPEVESTQAREVARRWLGKGWNKDPKLRRQAQVAEAFLCFLPFYRVEADAIGFALGTEERTRTVGTGKHRRVERYEVDVERGVEKSFDATYPALNLAEWGLEWIDLHGDRLVPFDRRTLGRQGMVFAPTRSEPAIREAAIEEFKVEAEPTTGLKRVRFRFLETIRERMTVIYYPLWVVRYTFRNRSYNILVDAEDASLGFGKAPGNDFYRAVALVASQAIALFIGTTVLRFAGGHAGTLVFVGVPVLAILIWGWRKFRYGGVVVEGSGVRRRAGLASTLGSLTTNRGRRRFLGDLDTAFRP